MRLLISLEKLNEYRSRDKIPCLCENCKSSFFITKNLVQRVLKGTKNANFCSKKCGYEFKRKKSLLIIKCENCHKDFKKRKCDTNISKNFCSQNCANVFNGKNKKTINHCYCGKEINKRRKYCSLACNKKHDHLENIKKWKSGEKLGYSGETCIISKFIKKYLFQKHDNKCCKCGWNQIHPITQKIPLEVNHIDGNAKNCKEENLELVCPNCHALTPNFRALNKKSFRKR
mgnify:CR=1 FL=1